MYTDTWKKHTMVPTDKVSRRETRARAEDSRRAIAAMVEVGDVFMVRKPAGEDLDHPFWLMKAVKALHTLEDDEECDGVHYLQGEEVLVGCFLEWADKEEGVYTVDPQQHLVNFFTVLRRRVDVVEAAAPRRGGCPTITLAAGEADTCFAIANAG